MERRLVEHQFGAVRVGDALRRGSRGRARADRTAGGHLAGQKARTRQTTFRRRVTAPDHTAAVVVLMGTWIEEHSGRDGLTAVGHRVVHGGPDNSEPERVTVKLSRAAPGFSSFDPEHLLFEIQLIEAFRQRHPALPQVACFDTALPAPRPRVAESASDPATLRGGGRSPLWLRSGRPMNS